MTPVDHSDAAIHAARLDRLTDQGLRAADIADDDIDGDTGIKKPAGVRLQ